MGGGANQSAEMQDNFTYDALAKGNESTSNNQIAKKAFNMLPLGLQRQGTN